jgi:exodeoxyribonuclease V beta subunit
MTKTENTGPVYIPKQSELLQDDPGKMAGNNSTAEIFHQGKNRLTMIEASAGTGKTFALVELVLELMFTQNIPLNSIVLVTFTDKATSELRLRLRAKLREISNACENNNNKFLTVPKGAYWEINKVRKDQIKAALLDFDSVPIYTIHGFCKRILQEFAFENRQLFEQQLIDINHLFPEVFRRYLRRDLLSNNTPVSQLFAIYVKHTEGSLETLENEIKNLLAKRGTFVPNFPSFDIFLNEFSERWKVLVERDLSLRETNSTEHPILAAFSATALNGTGKNNVMLNLKLLLETLSDAHSGRSLNDLLPVIFNIELHRVSAPKCRKNLRNEEKWLSPQNFPQAERDWIEAVSDCERLLQHHNLIGDGKKILRAWVTQQVLGDIRFELQNTKMEQGMYDYDDLLRLVEEQVKHSGRDRNVPTVLTKVVREKYTCAVVDEFQDTDHRQWNIFRNIFLESTEHRLIVIGDPKQAIYSFRGADIFTYMHARTLFEMNSARLPFSLKKNFRSTEILLCGLNHIFESNYWLPEKKGIVYRQVGCGKPELEFIDKSTERSGVHLLELLPQFTVSGKKIADQRSLKNPELSAELLNALSSLNGQIFYGKEDLIQAVESRYNNKISKSDQNAVFKLFLEDNAVKATSRFAEAIAQEIKTLLRKGHPGSERPIWKNEKGEHPLREQDICVLFRKSSEGEKIGQALRGLGIDFAFYKQKGLLSGREAHDIYYLLEAIANPHDHSRIAKVWLTRFFGANIQDLVGTTIIDSDFSNMLHEWNILAEARRFRKLFDQILLKTRLFERELFLSGDERSVSNYAHLFEVLIRQVMERHLDLNELSLLLKRFIDGEEDAGENENLLRLESERNAVQLMTIHASKGLEFPVVFLFGGLTANKKDTVHFYHDADEKPVIDFLSKNVPKEFSWQEEAEKQRLLYVAMTRACARLYLPYVGFIEGNAGQHVCKVNGDYGVINERLTTLDSGSASVRDKPAFSHSYCGKPVEDLDQTLKIEEQQNLVNWKVSGLPETPDLLGETTNAEESFRMLRHNKKGFVVSSFSRLSSRKEERHTTETEQGVTGVLPVEIRTENQLKAHREVDETIDQEIDSANDYSGSSNDGVKKGETKNEILPGGIQTGNMLHELLEHIDFNIILASRSAQDWLGQAQVRELIDSIRERYQLSAETVPTIAEIIWSTLRTPVRLGSGPDATKVELASCEPYLRETDFYFPIPGKGTVKNKDTDTLNNQSVMKLEGWNVEKGFLRGSIDFVFEHDGKIYLIDWKSNLLTGYNPESLEKEVMEHYLLQLQIYTLAISYWFKLDGREKYENRFGGVFYIFLRGMPNNEGAYFTRPGWNDLLDYEKRLSLENY